jgi:hypothetical protein
MLREANNSIASTAGLAGCSEAFVKLVRGSMDPERLRQQDREVLQKSGHFRGR